MLFRSSGKKDYRRSNSKEEVTLSCELREKIKKLKEIRQDRGASPAEEETAKKKIEILLAKNKQNKENVVKVEVTYPVFQANPPRMSWHVEKDGVIIAKGNGVAKYSDLRWFEKEKYEEALKTSDKNSWAYEDADKKLKLYKQFMTFINKIDTAAGAMLSKDGKGFVYENVVETKYKTENIAVESAGSLKNGQCFIVKTRFNHGINQGYVYQLNECDGINGKKFYVAYRLDKKLKKQLTGRGNRANCFGWISGEFQEKFLHWIETGSLAWCEIQEVKTAYEVTKCVKKAIKTA